MPVGLKLALEIRCRHSRVRLAGLLPLCSRVAVRGNLGFPILVARDAHCGLFVRAGIHQVHRMGTPVTVPAVLAVQPALHSGACAESPYGKRMFLPLPALLAGK